MMLYFGEKLDVDFKNLTGFVEANSIGKSSFCQRQPFNPLSRKIGMNVPRLLLLAGTQTYAKSNYYLLCTFPKW